MPYKVEVKWCPANELVASLRAYLQSRGYGSTFELGRDWSADVRKSGGKELAGAVDAAGGVESVDLLLLQSPDKESVEGSLEWLSSLSRGEVIDRLIGFYSDCDGKSAGVVSTKAASEMAAIATRWDKIVNLLYVWNRAYFKGVDPRILSGLRDDADAMRARIDSTLPEDLVEETTSGLRLEPAGEEVRVSLVPQFHMRPWNAWHGGRGYVFFNYPADVLAPEEGMPPDGLMRLTRALSDPNRLKILKAIASGAQSFTDVFAPSKLAKSTVHHHLMALRAAGLVRTHVSYPLGRVSDRYFLRAGALDTLAASLAAYLKEE